MENFQSPPAKRKKFTPDDDVILLRQVVADVPFSSGRGKIMDSWDSLASRVRNVPDFGIPTIEGKSAQARFNKLIDGHRAFDRESATLSGVSQTYTTRRQLLDECVLLVDEHSRNEKDKSDQEKAKAEKVRAAGDLVRAEALSRLKRPADDGDDDRVTKNARMKQFFALMSDDAERQASLRKEQWQQEREERERERQVEREERQAEREERRVQAQMEHERMMLLFQSFAEAIKQTK